MNQYMNSAHPGPYQPQQFQGGPPQQGNQNYYGQPPQGIPSSKPSIGPYGAAGPQNMGLSSGSAMNGPSSGPQYGQPAPLGGMQGVPPNSMMGRPQVNGLTSQMGGMTINTSAAQPMAPSQGPGPGQQYQRLPFSQAPPQNSYSAPASGPPSGYQGPPLGGPPTSTQLGMQRQPGGMYNPLNSMAGPPAGNMGGPLQGPMHAPQQGGMAGPSPSGVSGPSVGQSPSSMSGPLPTGLPGPPRGVGLPRQLPPTSQGVGPPGPMMTQGLPSSQPQVGGYQLSQPSYGPSGTGQVQGMQQQQRFGAPAYPGGPPVPLGSQGPPLSPTGPTQQSGVRPQYAGMAPGPAVGPAAAPQPPRKLDPDQMPSVIQVIETDRKNRGGQQFLTNTWGQVPPLVTTDFQVVDQGNASPRFLRSTMYSIPCNQDLLKQSQIPMGLVVSPFTQLPDNEAPPPITDHGPNGPVRCTRCKAYMCPFMTFVEGGRRFQCVFCGALTEVPPEYFQPLDHMGKRVDTYERPELSLGTFEYLATADYCKNSKLPAPPAYVFMIDVTYQSMKTGMVHLLCKELKSLLNKLPTEHGQKESAIRVGFVTYDTTLHFYNVNSALAQPQMLVVSDVHDVFMPLLDGFLVNLSESRSVIESLLDQIPQMFFETRETESMIGPVVQAGLSALIAADCVGKLFVFHSSLPIADAPGKLKNRDDRKLLGTEKEKTVLTPQVNFYSKLGQECIKAGCSVDLFLFPSSHVDLATISQVSNLTGGQIYKYNYFQAAVDGERFIHDLTRNIERPTGFDSVLRVRSSTGIRPTDFFGNFYMGNTTDVELASIDGDKAITVELKHDDKLQEDQGAYVQVALLYTSVSGQRRLRIFNLSFTCCSQMADLYRSCDTDTIINFVAKRAIKNIPNSNPKAIREGLINRCAQILACYRKNCASPSTQGQLILPECMKVLPLFVNSVIKSDAVSGCVDITTDDRSWLMQALLGMNVASTHSYFYPRLIPVHDISPEDTHVPAAIRCSADRFVDSGVYILENGIMMFLWVGLHVSNDWVQNVFGVNSPAQIDIDSTKLMTLDNPLSTRLRNLVENIRSQRPRYMKLTVVRQRDSLEPWFKHFLVEDKGANASASYVDFLVHMHKEIRNILS